MPFRSSRRSSQSSYTSRGSTDERSTADSTSVASHDRVFPRSPTLEASPTRSLRDVEMDILVLKLEQRMMRLLQEAGLTERYPAASMRITRLERAGLLQRPRSEVSQPDRRTRASNANHCPVLLEPRVMERTPDDLFGVYRTEEERRVGKSEGEKLVNESQRPKKPRLEVAGVMRPARPKTIWGTPAWE